MSVGYMVEEFCEGEETLKSGRYFAAMIHYMNMLEAAANIPGIQAPPKGGGLLRAIELCLNEARKRRDKPEEEMFSRMTELILQN